jgi:hypothetical protein
MHINMGHNATVVAVPAGAVDIWTGANLSTQALRPHASLLYTLPKTVR